jgi:hypothetical protein
MFIASFPRLAAAGLAVACVAACSASTGPSDSIDPTSRVAQPIIGGDADTGDPAVGLLYFVDHSTIPQYGFCTATLISADAILTAGHCAYDGDKTFLGFYLGNGAALQDSSHLQWTMNAVDVSAWYPGYDPTDPNDPCPAPGADVGVVHLKSSITDVKPMPYGTRAPSAGETCTTVGFGLTGDPADPLDRTTAQKRSGTLTVASFVGSDVSMAKGTAWPDTGDSGGPFVCGGSVLAVTSCAHYDKNHEFHDDEYLARVDTVTSWIDQQLDAWPHLRCYDYTVCVVKGHEVVPSDDDDPNTWCTNIGGFKRTKHKCEYGPTP